MNILITESLFDIDGVLMLQNTEQNDDGENTSILF
jgi:hypothetical protein